MGLYAIQVPGNKSIFFAFFILLMMGIEIYFSSGSGLIVFLVCEAYLIIRKMNLKLLNSSVAMYDIWWFIWVI